MDAPDNTYEYFSPVRMGLEIYEGEARQGRRSNTPSGISIFRDTWSDTVWVETFEDTRSRFNHVQGFMNTELQPGTYHYQLQLARGGSERERPSQVRTIVIPEVGSTEKTEILLLNELTSGSNHAEATLLNYGSNVLYGQNYTLLVRLPQNANGTPNRYKVNIQKSGETQSDSAPVFSESISTDQIITAGSSELFQQNDEIKLRLNPGDNGTQYAFIRVPNSEFENSGYKISFVDTESDSTFAERTVQSRWIDMPVSLYSLDVSINMLRFILSDRELREMNSGSQAERERKFREFWAQRDPTPDTEYNELMAEYYRRIDFSFQNFSSLQTPGYDTDRGKAYILYGPPVSIDRRLLPNQPTREIWEYPNRELIFEAVSGLGDFRLISNS